TSYFYQDPVFLPDLGGGPKRFRGFQAVTTNFPVLGNFFIAAKFERHSYKLDPDGLSDYVALSDGDTFDGPADNAVDQTVYAAEQYLGSVSFVHPTSKTHFECQPVADDPPAGFCSSHSRFTHTTRYDYGAAAQGGQTVLFTLET